MASTGCLPLIALVIFSSALPAVSFFAIQSPQPCSIGEACRHSFNRNYVNNYIFCCPNGGGSSVSSINNVIHCQCGGGTYVSNETSTIFVNGQQLNATEAQPYIEAMNRIHKENMEQFNRNMEQFHRNMQQFQQNMQNMQANLQARMAAMNARLSQMGRNMANRFRFW